MCFYAKYFFEWKAIGEKIILIFFFGCCLWTRDESVEQNPWFLLVWKYTPQKNFKLGLVVTGIVCGVSFTTAVCLVLKLLWSIIEIEKKKEERSIGLRCGL